VKKLLNDEAIIRLLDGVSDRNIKIAQENLTLPHLESSRQWLEYGVKEGLYATATIERDGQEVAVVFYHVDNQRTLVVNFAHSLRPDLDLTACLELSFRRLAGINGCLRVQFVTKRGGAIRKALLLGYELCGVVVRRDLMAGEGAPQDQLEQRNMESSSSSSEATSANETATNEQVGTSGPDSAAFGAGSSGNTSTVNISTTDEADLEASLGAATTISGTAIAAGADTAGAAIASNTTVAGTALASNTDVTNNALNAGVLGLKNAAALAQSGLTTAGDIAGAGIAAGSEATGAAIASNTSIAGTSIAAANDELNEALSANGSALNTAANVAGAAIASNAQTTSTALQVGNSELDEALSANTAATSSADSLVSQLGGESTAAVTNIAGAAIAGQLAAQSGANQLIGSAVNAIVAGNANSNATLASVQNGFTNALESSNIATTQLAAGALDQEQQVVGGVSGVQVAPAESDVTQTAQILQNVPTSVKVIVGLAVVAFGIYALAKLKE
jgi:hypothetical protein